MGGGSVAVCCGTGTAAVAEFVLGASADEVVGCRELYRRRLAASADRLLFRRRRIAGLDRRAVPSQLFPRATAFLNSSCSLG